MEVEFTSRLWQWDARRQDAWVFASVPQDLADEIADVAQGATRGFGSLRVEATIGSTTWRTSVFPSSSAETYVLPLKRKVRVAEGLEVDGETRVRLRLIDV